MPPDRDVLSDRLSAADVMANASARRRAAREQTAQTITDLVDEVDRLKAENERLHRDLGQRDDFLHQIGKLSRAYEDALKEARG